MKRLKSLHKKQMQKRLLAAVIVAAVGIVDFSTVSATSLKDAQDKKSQAQSNLDNINNTIGDLKSEQSQLENEKSQYDSQLMSLLTDMDVLEQDIANKQDEIDQANADLETAQQQEQTQYDSMKVRIQYMYEQGNDSVWTAIIGAKSITAAGTPLGFAPEEQKSADAQFAAVKAAVIAELRRTFRPEFLNRVDETIVFRRLSREDCAEIARRLLAQTVSRAAALGITLEADEGCAVSLAERGYDVSYGARPLRRLIRSEVEDALATCLLDGTLASGDTAVLAAENGTLCVRRREKAAAAALGDVGAQKA